MAYYFGPLQDHLYFTSYNYNLLRSHWFHENPPVVVRQNARGNHCSLPHKKKSVNCVGTTESAFLKISLAVYQTNVNQATQQDGRGQRSSSSKLPPLCKSLQKSILKNTIPYLRVLRRNLWFSSVSLSLFSTSATSTRLQFFASKHSCHSGE